MKCLHQGFTEVSTKKCVLTSLNYCHQKALTGGSSCLMCGQVSFYVLDTSVYELGQSWHFWEHTFVLPALPNQWEFSPLLIVCVCEEYTNKTLKPNLGLSLKNLIWVAMGIVARCMLWNASSISHDFSLWVRYNCCHTYLCDSTPIQHKYRQWIPRNSAISNKSF